MRIKGVLFDVDGTLYYQKPLRLFMIFHLIVSHIVTPWKLPRIFKVILAYRKAQEKLRLESDKTKGHPSRQLEVTISSTGESKEYVADIISEWFEKKPLKFLIFFRRRNLLNLLRELQKKNIKSGVFSDYPAYEKLRALKIDQYFTTIVSSHDSGINGFKPHTNGFAVAAEKMGLTPVEILYVGDRVDTDGRGAVAAGMKAVIIRTSTKNQSEFKIHVIKDIQAVMREICC